MKQKLNFGPEEQLLDVVRTLSGHLVDVLWQWQIEWDRLKVTDLNSSNGDRAAQLEKEGSVYNWTVKSHRIASCCGQNPCFFCLEDLPSLISLGMLQQVPLKSAKVWLQVNALCTWLPVLGFGESDLRLTSVLRQVGSEQMHTKKYSNIRGR